MKSIYKEQTVFRLSDGYNSESERETTLDDAIDRHRDELQGDALRQIHGDNNIE